MAEIGVKDLPENLLEHLVTKKLLQTFQDLRKKNASVTFQLIRKTLEEEMDEKFKPAEIRALEQFCNLLNIKVLN